MAIELRCPRGHPWEFDDGDTRDAKGNFVCPVCGIEWTLTATVVQSPDDIRAIQAELSPPPPVNASQPIPGFEIQGVLGSGGMGTVYKARHVKMDRVVALKVPHADRMDLASRLRVQAEARAAAHLQHPGIVQVFEVGETDGRPYLVLEFCPGGSLARRLTGTPLAPRVAAEVVAAVAVAVGHAHRAGVIHRDLKPDNILLGAEPQTAERKGRDSTIIATTLYPMLKVADFGLARRTEDQSQTQTGTVMGTPCYMAPEQARGDVRHVGPPADVYALGAVLYELLTGRPPFKGTTPMDTLDQVCTRDPIPPSRLQPTVPRDLETVALACLRKGSEKRYPTAVELADDLKRFLTGRPVLARPVGWPERLVKRARRNPVLSALLLLLVLAIAAGVGVAGWKQVRLIAERDRARSHFQMSMRAIDELLTEVAEQDLAAEPRAEQTRRALLEKAMRFYQELLSVEAGDPSVAWEAARAARRTGDIYRLLGRYPDARTAYDQAAARFEKLRLAGRDDAEFWREVALVHNWRGEVCRLTEQLDAAEAEYTTAAEIQSRLRVASPDAPAPALDLAQSFYNRGIVAGQKGRYADAEAHFRRAADALFPPDRAPPEQRQHTARIAINLSDVLRKAGRPADAAAAALSAVGNLDALIAAHPSRPDYRHERAAAEINLAIARSAAGERDAAIAAAADARRRLEELVREFPSTPLYRVDLARVCTTMAELEYARNRKVAETHTRAAIGHWEAVLAIRPNVPSDHGELGIALGNLGRLSAARPAEAREHLTRGIPEVLTALRANPDDADFRQSLRQQARDLADLLVRAGDDVAVAQEAERIRDGLPAHHFGAWRAVCFLARAAATAGKIPAPLEETARRADAFAKQAIAIVRKGNATLLAGLLDDPDCDPIRKLPAFREALRRPDK
ncbi:serine/threonine-protein kinase [Limnoglobus roseus]|uniref:Serine/threonine protein kinase n=1 Tax=Limnoglobus roseus TaxID=2598579 RepID=A0A5C1AFJ3_9BACT|nr:serine/threonine-protein kinase [Limnoglobus roseus]QEL16502.1 serine/threonine protein kinase [Limnoglobus roseus]